MKIGIPGGLLYYRYEPFIRTFFNELSADAEYSTVSNREILDLGARHCVDEACLPMKIFHGHAAKLNKTCDAVAVPRIMNCEFGESICPKFRGLPELVQSGTGKSNQIFTEPIYMNDQKKLKKALRKGCREIGVPIPEPRRRSTPPWRISGMRYPAWTKGDIAIGCSWPDIPIIFTIPLPI